MIRTRILPFAAWLVVSLWSRSLRVVSVNRSGMENPGARGNRYIYAFWHGDLFLLLHTYRNSGVLIPVSESSDGDIMAGVLRRFGFGVVRGSSSRNGHKALIRMMCGARKGGTIGVAVDGPRGPLHQAKRGAVYLAGRTGIPVVPVAAAARRFWILNSTWEKLMLPRPFTKGVVVFGAPVIVNGASEEAIESGRKALDNSLRSLSEKARELAAEKAGGCSGFTRMIAGALRRVNKNISPGKAYNHR